MAINNIAIRVFLKSAVCSLLLSWLLTPFVVVSGLECYTCNNVNNPGDCTTVITCKVDHFCAVDYYTSSDGGYYTTGCKHMNSCTSIEGYPGGSIPVGKRDSIRRVADDMCSDCCTDAKCNVKPLACATPAPPCVDTLAACSQKAFRDAICINDEQSKSFCQKSCGFCPISGGWSSWGQYSGCSATCGDGSRTRIRLCVNPPPSNNGPNCAGSGRETDTCNSGTCPVDGHWSDWSHWSRCSATCGAGYSIRVRNCNNPHPDHGGSPCPDAANFRQTQQCYAGACTVPIDGHWSPWSSWSHCSATCGSGYIIRVRNCNNPLPQHGGKPCPNAALFRETQPCHVTPCPVDGHWSDWSSWSGCSATCGPAFSIRVRNCNNPLPANGGQACQDAANFRQTRQCTIQSCSGPTAVPAHTTHQVVTKAPPSPSPVTSQSPSPTWYIIPPMMSTLTSPSPTPPGCHDHAFCEDAHVKPVACNDPYIAATYCQKLCGLCGTAHIQQPCTDHAGPRCMDSVYFHFVCGDPDLAILCSRACGLCH